MSVTTVTSRFSRFWDVLIDLKERGDILYWSRRLACTEYQLRAATRAVGAKAADVRRYLGR